LQIYHGYIGHETNNATKLEGLLYGIYIAINSNFSKLIVEGDSQIILHMLTKVQHGSEIDKISSNWRLESMLHQLKSLLSSKKVILPHHIMRTGNKLADYLVNQGVKSRMSPHSYSWNNYMDSPSINNVL